MRSDKKLILMFGLLVLGAFLAACASPSPPVETVITTVTVENTVRVTSETVVQVVTSTPEPPDPRTLNICLGQEPESLYLYDGNDSGSKFSVLEAIYDGPIDNRSFDHQPVILEKLPNLDDGDADVRSVEVEIGDPIVDDFGELAVLETGVIVRPSGCSSSDCAISYDGESPFRMDQLEVTFELLPGLSWSDGTPLTARDSIYSFNLAAHPDTPEGKFKTDRTAEYKALDDRTVQWIGMPGFMDTTYFLNFWQPLPEHLWAQFSAEELLQAEASTRSPLGWGPYIVETWTPGESLLLRKNPAYFRSDQGLPVFEHVVFRFIGEDSNTKIAQLLSGECDVIDQSSHLEDQVELLLEMQAAGRLRAVFSTDTAWEHADFGLVPFEYDDGWQIGDRPDFFGDVRTRRALAMCMDRQGVVDSILFGRSVVPDTYLPPQHPLYNADVRKVGYDPDGANDLLEEVGWVDDDEDPSTPRVFTGSDPRIPPGTPFVIDYWTTSAPQRLSAAEFLAQNLAECGVQAEVRDWSLGEFYVEGPDGPLFGRRFDIGQFAWESDVVPFCDLYLSEAIPGDSFLFVGDVPWLRESLGEAADPNDIAFPYAWAGWNNVGYSSPDYDKACRAGLTSLPGQTAYAQNHLRAQEIFARDLPVIPLYIHLKVAATRPDMCGYLLDPTSPSEMWNIEMFDYGACAQE